MTKSKIYAILIFVLIAVLAIQKTKALKSIWYPTTDTYSISDSKSVLEKLQKISTMKILKPRTKSPRETFIDIASQHSISMQSFTGDKSSDMPVYSVVLINMPAQKLIPVLSEIIAFNFSIKTFRIEAETLSKKDSLLRINMTIAK